MPDISEIALRMMIYMADDFWRLVKHDGYIWSLLSFSESHLFNGISLISARSILMESIYGMVTDAQASLASLITGIEI